MSTSWVLGMIACGMALAGAAHAAENRSLELESAISLPGVQGRIDHFAMDLPGRRLFVAALGNDTVEILDLQRRAYSGRIRGLAEPQGVAYVEPSKRLFVANGHGGRVDLYDGQTFASVARVGELPDADNLRYEVETQMVYVGYSGGALRALDAATGAFRSEVPLPGHPESFQMERAGARIFVNIPSAHQVAVVDRHRNQVIGAWALREAANFPMALDEQGHRLFVATRKPARLVVLDTENGHRVASLPIGRDADDLFFDRARERIYAICGEGRVNVIEHKDGQYRTLDSIPTAPGARTGLFVPELDRLYVAVPKRAGLAAEVREYRPR